MILTDVKRILKGVLISMLISVVLLLLGALLLTFTSMPESFIPAIVEAITLISIFAAGIKCAKGAQKAGWLFGMSAAVGYYIALVVISMLTLGGISFGASNLGSISAGLIVGAIGGIVGINL